MKSLLSRFRTGRQDRERDKENNPLKQQIAVAGMGRSSPSLDAASGSVGRRSNDVGRVKDTWTGKSKAKERKFLPNPVDVTLARTAPPPNKISPLSSTPNDQDHFPHPQPHVPRAPSIEPLSAFEVAALGGTREEYLQAGGAKKVAFISPVPTPTASLVLDLMVDSNLNLDQVGEELMRENVEEYRWRGGEREEIMAGPSGTIRAGSSRRPSLPRLDTGYGDQIGPCPVATEKWTGSRPREHSEGPTSTRTPVATTTTYPKSAMAPSLRPKPSLSSNYGNLPQSPIDPTRPPHARSMSSRPASIADSLPFRSPSLNTPTSSVLGSNLGQFYNTRTNWSEMADSGYGDLIANLSPRERVRQEVLWEIISSEERYLNDLLQLRETFIEPMLQSHSEETPMLPSFSSGSLAMFQPRSDSFSSARSSSENHHIQRQQRSSSDSSDVMRAASIDMERLPIAARFASPTFEGSDGTGASGASIRRRGQSTDSALQVESEVDEVAPLPPPAHTNPVGTRQKSAYNLLSKGRPSGTNAGSKPAARSHNSLPPPPKNQSFGPGQQSISASYAATGGKDPRLRYSLMPTHDRAVSDALKLGGPPPSLSHHTHNKLRKRLPSGSGEQSPHIRSVTLPLDLRQVLSAIDEKIIAGHVSLHEALKQRYLAQYPLVRSLADIFLAHSDLFREYELYVLHLEKALNQIDRAAICLEGKKRDSSSSDSSSLEQQRLRTLFRSLDTIAADKGEAGLAISVSKPFSRLLKYPLLFRNLLYNTDPSMKEYEATLRMVEDIERIVLGIEDEKSTVEDKERTRDVFARIEGLEREKAFIAPRQMRMLVTEAETDGDYHDDGGPRKRSSKRLSDLLKGQGSAGHEHWLITFTDVTLLCEKIGTTSVPAGSSAMKADETRTRRQERKDRKASAGNRRSHQPEYRNLYKYVKTEVWHLSVEDAYDYAGLKRTEAEPSQMLSESDHSDQDSDTGGSDASDAHTEASFSYDIPDEPQPISPLILAPARHSLDSLAKRGMAATRLSSHLPKPPTHLPKPPTHSKGTLPRPKTSSNSTVNQATSTNAKFGTRLRSSDSPADHAVSATEVARPTSASRTRQSAPPGVRSASVAANSRPGGAGTRNTANAKHDGIRPPATTIGRGAPAASAAGPMRVSPPTIRLKASASNVGARRTSDSVGPSRGSRTAPDKKPPSKTWI